METNNKVLFIVSGILSISAGVIATICFLFLGKIFGYPEIIRETPQVILGKLYETRNLVPYLYYIGVGGAGICIFFLSLLLRKIFQLAGDDIWGYLGQYCGMVVGICLYAGIIRYTFLFPFLARLRAEGIYDPKTIDLVFEAFNTYVGESIAEHVQFTFMFFWLLFFSIAILKTRIINKWIAVLGVVLSIVIFYGNLELFGAPGAFLANRQGSDFVALWAVALGVNLIWARNTKPECATIRKA
ncbi:DUF4386 family protein [Candidatus Poribacteria bacterium]|nr:DUF4386 family protein [Candidatus Poribacteria bacterium]